MTADGRASAVTDTRSRQPTDLGMQWLRQAGVQALRRRSRAENFPVATLALSRPVRDDLLALYVVARLIDETGDSSPGAPADRLALLDVIAADVRQLPAGRPALAPIADLLPAVRQRALPIRPLLDLIEANRRDQVVTRYATFDELGDYCRLSADPVGRLVLHVFGCATEDRVVLSDHICTALQLAEHWQDVGEDLRAGRVYLPQASLDRHGVELSVLSALAGPAPAVTAAERERVAALLRAEAARARGLLRAGSPLVATLPARARLAVSGFVAGGHAALDAIEGAGADAVATTPRPRRAALLRHAARTVVTGGRR